MQPFRPLLTLYRTIINGATCGTAKTFPFSQSTICHFLDHRLTSHSRLFPSQRTPQHYRLTSRPDPQPLHPSHPRTSKPHSSPLNSQRNKNLLLPPNSPQTRASAPQKPTFVPPPSTPSAPSRSTTLTSALARSHSSLMPHRQPRKKYLHWCTYPNTTFPQIAYKSKSQAERGR